MTLLLYLFCLMTRVLENLLYPLFSLEKKGILISYQSRSVVHLSVRPCGCASVTFLVNVSPPKRLDVATSNFVAE